MHVSLILQRASRPESKTAPAKLNHVMLLSQRVDEVELAFMSERL
jgi:hypothetical protein